MDRLVLQVKQRVPLPTVLYNDVSAGELLDEEVQRKFLLVVRAAAEHNPYYAREVLKKVIERVERLGGAAVDEFYELLCELLPAKALGPTDTDILTYTVGTQEIKIRESPNLISGMGTTGLRTWEASLYLTQYLLEKGRLDGSDFKDRTVLELGCGTGFVGIALHMTGQHVVLSDGDTQLLDRMSSNLALNGIGTDELEACKLWWGEDGLPPAEQVDTIVAADVTYDASVIPALIETLDEAMSQANGTSGYRVKHAYIAATVRNEETIATWEKYLDAGQDDGIWTWQVLATSTVDSGLAPGSNVLETVYYPVGVGEIRIYRLANAM